MKKALLLLSLGLLNTLSSLAGDDKKYPVKDIPAELRKGADAVKRSEEYILTIDGIGSARLVHRYAITILNKHANEFTECVVQYDKLTPFKGLKGQVYDSTGVQVAKLKSSDILDVKTGGGDAFYDDNRVKAATIKHHTYPFTVEFEEESAFNGILWLPPWQPVDHFNLSVQQSTFKIIYPSTMNIRFKEMRVSTPLKQSTENDKIVLEWNLTDYPAVKSEVFAPKLNERTPLVLLAPSQFEIEGYKGDMSTWQSFGLWNYQLNADRNVLPEAMKAKVKELIANIGDKREQVKVLYEYLQKNTRYVGVQLGIGGWQTFDANYVASRGYGDCKALTNYMHSLLKEAGIPSNPTLVYAGDGGANMHIGFPSNQFNHVILNVPMEKDSIWLECTSQYNAFNYLGQFTADRWVLSFNKEGGKLIKTPVLALAENKEKREAKVIFDMDGNGKVDLKSTYCGAMQDDLSADIAMESKGELEKKLYKEINLSGVVINSFSHEVDKGKLPTVIENVKFDFNNYINISGKRLFLQPNLLNQFTWVPDKSEKRTCEIVMKFPYVDEDKIEYVMPDGFSGVESKPVDVNLKSRFGEFTTTTKVEKNTVTYYRKLVMNSGRFDASTYNELADFFAAIAKADKSKVVLLNNGGGLATN
ncbi:DUF3857 domain-containing transglutaminase family protein [Solitalea lacus]|uniref:DUF3857 domain-containing transglutaminase family protein n=1 Tax=Solitalea lacus TaxID=2911172 RepID=UPI001EDA39E5|nr:DUF3857 and transglutaminase domain-containing protein [Solitalea lacus]UKJ07384.1 DUF3857 and transglutaminase domain-containing protein [Solitalea lacus]